MFDLLIPVGEQGSALRDTLRSVQESTRQPARVILVFDGVRVGDRAWLDQLGFDLVVLEQMPRRGITAALKAGEASLVSPFLARLDVGDTVTPRRFAVQLASLEADPELVAVGVRTRLTFEGPSVERLSMAADAATAARVLPLRNLFVHGSLMFRTAAFQRVGGYDPTFPTSQDYDLLLRLSATGRLLVVPEVLQTHVFRVAGSTMRKPHTQLRMSLRAKWRHFRRGSRLSPGFVAYFLRDAASLLVPAALLARWKARAG